MNPPPMQQRINFNPNQQQPQFQNFQQQRPQQIQGNLPPPSYGQQAPLVNGFNATPASSHQIKNVTNQFNSMNVRPQPPNSAFSPYRPGAPGPQPHIQGPPGGKPPNMQQVGSQPPMPLSGAPSGPPSGPPSLNAASGPNSLNLQQFNQRPSSGAPISPPISQPPTMNMNAPNSKPGMVGMARQPMMGQGNQNQSMAGPPGAMGQQPNHTMQGHPRPMAPPSANAALPGGPPSMMNRPSNPPMSGSMSGPPGMMNAQSNVSRPQGMMPFSNSSMAGPHGMMNSNPSPLAKPPGMMNAAPSSMSGPPGMMIPPSMSGPTGMMNAAPSSMNGPPGMKNPQSMSGPGGMMNAAPSSMSGPPGMMNAAPSSMSGPPGMMNAAPSSMAGPRGMINPSSLSGPPGMMNAAPPSIAGPPGMMNTAPPSMAGPPGMMNTAPPSMAGPPGMLNRPPGPGQMNNPYGIGQQNYNSAPGMPPTVRQPQQLGAPMAGPMGAPQAKRIDPNQMPNPIQVMDDDQGSFDGEIFATSSRGKVPPLVSTKCRIQDDGNCSPRYMRSSVYSVPCNQDMLKDSGIPMAIITTPFAKIPADEHQIRYVDHGPTGPVRCNRCKAYMNPFMQFIDGGRRYVCNICSHSSEVPQEYFCHLDHQGRRVDMYERPELCFGSYEYIATTDYCKDSKLPSPPAFIFMIDVSYQSVQQGMVKILCDELQTLLDDLPKDVGMDESLIKVGFVTYSSQLHFYNVKENLAQPQMMVMSDVDEAFVPLLDGFLVNYKESKGVIESLLDMLPEMFKDTRETDVVLGPVITAGIDALKSAGISGKLYIFHSSLPIAEAPGKLKNREDRKLLNTDKEKTILIPQGNYYMNLAKECVTNGVSIDLFLFPNSYVDVATIGLMVTQTGGQIYRYSYFKEATHGKQFVCDLRKNFSREVGFDAIMRLRCSTGLRPVEFFGSFMMNNTTDVELASIDSHKAIAIEIKHDDKIPEDGVTFLQCALLYTSVAGQRRLRIHNLAFSTCSQLADLYRCCELDTTVNYLSKFALRQVLSSNPQSIKENLIQRCVQILACYRQHCATPSTSGQLILPECMKLLPLYVNCLIKSDVLSGGSEMSSDDRAFLMQACLSMSPSISASYFYPRVIELHTLDLDHEDELIPKQIRCLGEKFKDNGVYLLENTISMFIWVGLQTSQEFLHEVFGVNGIGQLDIEMTQLPEIDSPLSQRIREIIEAVQDERQRYLKLTIVRQRDKLEPWFKHYIVEDKGFQANHLSYVDFLCHVHKEIRSLLS